MADLSDVPTADLRAELERRMEIQVVVARYAYTQSAEAWELHRRVCHRSRVSRCTRKCEPWPTVVWKAREAFEGLPYRDRFLAELVLARRLESV